jgi:uncharacterized membrane protein YdbT with pleckstrin-like domain
LYAGINGLGQGKYDSSLIFPIVKAQQPPSDNNDLIRSPKKALSSYITKWLIALSGAAIGCVFSLTDVIPLIFFYPLLIMALVCLFIIFINVNKWRSCYLSLKGEILVICNLEGVKKHTYITERKKCRKIQISQSIFQKRRDIADLRLYLWGYNNKKVRIRHLPMEKCMEIAEKL